MDENRNPLEDNNIDNDRIESDNADFSTADTDDLCEDSPVQSQDNEECKDEAANTDSADSDQNNPPKTENGYYNSKGEFIFPDGSYYDMFGQYHPGAEPEPINLDSAYAFNWSPDNGNGTCDPTNEQVDPIDLEIRKKKKMSAFKKLMIVLACVFGVVLLLLGAVLVSGIFESAPDAGKDRPDVNIVITDKGPTTPEDGLASAELLEQVNSSVVVITNEMKNSTGLGSGFIISDDGYIVTNSHVITDSEALTVTLYDGSTYQATLIGHSEKDDLAVIKINATNLPVITLGKSANCYVGERVYAIGCPDNFDLAWTVTMGIISRTSRNVKIYDDDGSYEKTMTLIQTDVAVNHGNSGGPLINTRGEVVGIVTLKLSNNAGLGFAIPIDGALEIITALIQDGNANNVDSSVSKSRPMIGITCIGVSADTYYKMNDTGIEAIVTEQYANQFPDMCIYAPVAGIYVISIDERYNAKDVLKVGDVIVSFDGNSVFNNTQLTYYLNDCSAGDRVELKVYRNGEYITVELLLAKQIQ